MESSDGSSEELKAEAYGTRRGDQVIPITWRDLRFNRVFPNPEPGTVALVGYGGGFLSFGDASGGDGYGSVTTLYCPYDFTDGVPAKAHVLALDPDGEFVSLIHGDGYALVMDASNGITMRGDGGTWLSIKAGVIELAASSISLLGNVALGRDTTSAVPLLAGSASQPTPSVFFSPT